MRGRAVRIAAVFAGRVRWSLWIERHMHHRHKLLLLLLLRDATLGLNCTAVRVPVATHLYFLDWTLSTGTRVSVLRGAWRTRKGFGLRLVVRRAVHDCLERAARVTQVRGGGVAARLRYRCRRSVLCIMGVRGGCRYDCQYILLDYCLGLAVAVLFAVVYLNLVKMHILS
jgi:hypothetical protein